MVDRLGTYADLGIDRVIMNLNFGLGSADTLEAIQCFAEEVMPHFTDRPARIRAQKQPPACRRFADPFPPSHLSKNSSPPGPP